MCVAYTLNGAGLHPVFERADEVLVHPVRLLVSPLALARLLLEPPPLIDGIVELGVGVGELAPTDVELEAVDQARVAGLAPGQGRELDGEVGDEGRLDQAR